jgi:hypothetical protein
MRSAARAGWRAGRGRPIRRHGRQIIMATTSVPKKVIRHSWITQHLGSSVTATPPATPEKLPIPPRSTITKISAERWNPNWAESMNGERAVADGTRRSSRAQKVARKRIVALFSTATPFVEGADSYRVCA